jgi:hypothetical protein
VRPLSFFLSCDGKNLRTEYVSKDGRHVIWPMDPRKLLFAIEDRSREIRLGMRTLPHKLDLNGRSVQLFKWEDEWRRNCDEVDLLFFLSVIR